MNSLKVGAVLITLRECPTMKSWEIWVRIQTSEKIAHVATGYIPLDATPSEVAEHLEDLAERVRDGLPEK